MARKVVLMMSVSLDGFFEGPDHDLSWQLISDEVHQHFNDWIKTCSGFFDGRRTYELMVDFWPTADLDPDNPAPVQEFAGIWRDMPKVVFSRTLEKAEWNTAIEREVVPEQIRSMKEQSGGDLLVGGANLAATFLEHDLVDDFRIYVHPVVIGTGTPLFPGGMRIDLDLAETRAFGNGVVLLRYERRRE